jgi:hypothetical protein
VMDVLVLYFHVLTFMVKGFVKEIYEEESDTGHLFYPHDE